MNREEVRLCIAYISRGNPCPACGAMWLQPPDTLSRRREMHHQLGCDYVVSNEEYQL